jgi:hypothetical protein
MEFKRGANPKASLGVGLFSNRSFETYNEMRMWLIQNHSAVLDTKGLISSYPTSEQFAELREYVCQYLSIKDRPMEMNPDWIVDGVAEFYRDLYELRLKHMNNMK